MSDTAKPLTSEGLGSMRREFADNVIDYMKTRNTPFVDWEEAVREAIHLLLTEARCETLRCLGGYRIPKWLYLRERNDPRPTAPDVWVVPD